jgi:hypothetical protein
MGELGRKWIMVLDPEKLKDRLIVRWALDRIKHAREIEDRDQLKELSLLFNERSLVQAIEMGDRNLVSNLFVNLPADWLTSIRQHLLGSWLSWKGNVAYWSAMRIAELAPKEFCSVLSAYAESPGIIFDATKLSGAFLAIAHIGAGAAPIMKSLTAKVDSEATGEIWWRLLSDMVKAAVVCGMDESISLLTRGLEIAEREYEKQCLDNALSAAYETIAPNLPYFAQIGDMSKAKTDQSFEQLPELFENGAPLKLIDRATKAKGNRMLEMALELLPSRNDLSEIAGFACSLAKAAPKARNKSCREMLAWFLLASTAAYYAKKRFAFENYDIAAVLAIASYDVASLPCYGETLASLKKFRSEELGRHMPEALLKAQDRFGGVHLTAMMGDLRQSEFIDPLIDCLNRNSGDYLCESAQVSLAKIGATARQAIISRWPDFDFSQRIYSYGVLQRAGGDETTVQFLRERFTEVRLDPDKLECWCDAAEASPHRDLLEILEGELHRKLYVVDSSYCTLCALLDIESPKLQEAKKRIELHNARMPNKPFDEITVEEVLDVTASIQLRCEACGEANQFPMTGVYIDPNRPKDGFCIGGDLICPSCHAFGPFEPALSR